MSTVFALNGFIEDGNSLVVFEIECVFEGRSGEGIVDGGSMTDR